MATTGSKETPRSPSKGPPQAMMRTPELATTMARPFAPAMFSPFSMMRRMFDDMEQLLGSVGMGEQPGESRGGGLGSGFTPRVDVLLRDGKLFARLDLPGLAPEDIRVTIEDNALQVEGERRAAHEESEGDYWRAERIYGRFRRLIPLPEGVELDTAEARFANGVLEISMRAPGSEGRGRRVEVKGGTEPPPRPEAGSH